MTRLAHPVATVALLLALGCGDDSPPQPEPGRVVAHLRVLDPDMGCFETRSGANRVFRTQQEWDDFFSANVICYDGIEQLTPAPELDFDRYALIMALHEGDCAYSGCTQSYPLITGVWFDEGRITVSQRTVYQEELSTCLACVQPRDFILLDAALADAYPIEFQPREERPRLCP